MSALIPVITTKGLAAVFSQTNAGFAAEITHIALGDSGRTPSKNEIGLVREKMRIPIADGQRINDTQIHVTALADGATEFWVREIGFILKDGTMLAVWSDSQPLAYKSAAVPLLLAFDLVLAALPAQSVTVQGTGANLSLAAYADKLVCTVAANMLSSAASIRNSHENLKLSERIRELEI